MPRGGARPGAGRKPKPKPESAAPAGFTDGAGRQADAAPADWPFGTKPPPAAPPQSDASALSAAGDAGDEIAAGPADEQPVAAMLRVMREATDPRLILQAAVAAAPYLHPKKAAISAKAEGGAEKKASRFAPPAPPRLVSSR